MFQLFFPSQPAKTGINSKKERPKWPTAYNTCLSPVCFAFSQEVIHMSCGDGLVCSILQTLSLQAIPMFSHIGASFKVLSVWWVPLYSWPIPRSDVFCFSSRVFGQLGLYPTKEDSVEVIRLGKEPVKVGRPKNTSCRCRKQSLRLPGGRKCTDAS